MLNNVCVHIAIPAMNEMETLPQTLSAIAQQSILPQIRVYVCVNQPEEWWQLPEKRQICENNLQLLNQLRLITAFPLTIIDRSSGGCGWQGKQCGVGWARKVLFDSILSIAAPDDIVVSMDADTVFGTDYIESVLHNLQRHKTWQAISVPYYHRLTSDDSANRAILRYELYLRSYAINMLRINSPYSFTAIGSAIAARVTALRKIGGITPMKSGEDFYLLQKLRKMGQVGSWNEQMVYPAARFSDRVFFGTGPAMIKGALGDWNSYPIYHHQLFNKIEETYQLIRKLYHTDIQTDFISFLQSQFKESDFLQPLRKNVKDPEQFMRAFHEKADGLRILQFLKQEQNRENIPDELSLFDNLTQFLQEEKFGNTPSYLCSNKSLNTLSTEQLNEIRNLLFQIEVAKRKRTAQSL